MGRRTLSGGNAVTSTKLGLVTGSEVPHLNEDNVAVLKASDESNHDMADVRENVSRGNINNDVEEGSNRSSHDYLDGDDMCWNFFGGKSCFCCNEGGELLVCAERDCPISLHAKCLCIEPKFDDKGNFYCPYCWYKRAWAEAQESREKAFLAKKDLSKFFFQNGITSGKLTGNDVGVKTREPKGVSVMGNGSGLEYHNNRPGNKGVLDIANANCPQVNTDVSSSRKEYDILNNYISRTHETRIVEGQERIKLEDLSYNNEHVHVMTVEHVKPLSSFRFGESTDGNLHDYAFANGMQGGLEVYVDKSRVKDSEKIVQNELNLCATDCSVSGTGDSDSEPLPMKESCVKQEGGQRTSLQRKSRTGSKNDCFKNEEVANSETLELPQRYSMQSCSNNLTLETGKRKRLSWTVEEVNMLQEGVFRFGMGQPHIPWKKILEYGSHVFHNKRNTHDLKDKWKHLKF